ncbi:MAG: ribosome silencing factor [Spirochaetaceae bacterium]|nr:MAG: ribosome silencing factor [Spirochaetaceae bacterium]
MEDMYDNKKEMIDLASMLDEHNAGDVLVLDIAGQSSIADYFVIATVSSEAYLRGLVDDIDRYCDGQALEVRMPDRRHDGSGWTVMDGGWFVIHLMTKEIREFYDLERLWFHSPRLYGEELQSASSAGQSSSSSVSS